MTQHKQIELGLTKPFACSYLADLDEQLLVVLDEICYNPTVYESLLAKGFRRSGEQIYRPHCPSCKQCESVRVLTDTFTPSKSQKRIQRKNAHFTVNVSYQQKAIYFDLYSRYINARHQDGSMYPPNEAQFQSFLSCHWLEVLFLELWDHNNLIGVAVTDNLPSSLSAIYSFFDPDYSAFSLGSALIMAQIDYAKTQQKPYLYLGYQIDASPKMRYKTQYLPAHIYHEQKSWLALQKTKN